MSDLPFPPLSLRRAEPIGRELYSELRKVIIMGLLRPGQLISEAQVADSVGASRTPVREVFRRLADDGFLRIMPQIGTFVSTIPLQAVYDGQFVRETLECRTVQMAAQKRSEGDEAILSACLERQRRTASESDLPGFFAADDAMHNALIRIAGRPAIWALIQGVKAHMDRVRYLSLRSGEWLSMLVEQHETIVMNVTKGDAASAEAAMQLHLRSVFETIKQLAEESPELFDRADVFSTAGEVHSV